MAARSRKTSTADADRDVSLALQAWLAGDKEAVAAIVKTTPDLQDFALSALLVAYFAVQSSPRPEEVLAAVRKMAEEPPPQTQQVRCRAFLRRVLADGELHLWTDLWDEAVATGVVDDDDEDKAKKAIRNAAQQLRVKSIWTDAGPAWSMPESAIERQELIERAKRVARGQRASR